MQSAKSTGIRGLLSPCWQNLSNWSKIGNPSDLSNGQKSTRFHAQYVSKLLRIMIWEWGIEFPIMMMSYGLTKLANRGTKNQIGVAQDLAPSAMDKYLGFGW